MNTLQSNTKTKQREGRRPTRGYFRGALFGYSQRLYRVYLPQICVQRPGYQTAPSGLSIEASLTARLGDSQQWHVHLNINKIIKSAPWDIKHTVTSFGAATGTTYSPKTLPQYTSPHRVHRNKATGEYVNENDPMGWLPHVSLESKGPADPV